MPVLDQFGRPFPEQPRRPVDVAAVARIQDPARRWANTIPVTPELVFNALTAAMQGSADDYLTLAEMMEERNLHYASMLQTRKLAVTGEEIDVLPGDESALGAEIAEAYKRRVVDSYAYRDMLTDLLDGLAKGYSVVQPVWKTAASGWDYQAFEWQDPRLFKFEPTRMRELRIRSDEDDNGKRMQPGQFIVHMPRVRTAIPIRAGMARPAATAYLFHATTIKQWATFINVFGMPTRIGRYDPGVTTERELEELRKAVINLGYDAAAILPMGMQIEAFDARRPASGDNVFKEFAEYWDALISKLVLGQTMTADNGSSLAQAKVHNEVRLDLKRSDARQLAATDHREIATPWVFYNYGEGAPVPHIRLDVEPPEDLELFSRAITPLISAGLRVKSSELREKFGLTEPLESDETPAAPPEPDANMLAQQQEPR